MKRVSLILLGLLFTLWAMPVQAFDHNHKLWQAELGKYVENGYVHYGAWKRNRANLDRYRKQLESVSMHETASWSPMQRHAFWINAYNALVVTVILDNYPFKLGSKVVSIRDMYNNLHWTIAGQEVSLDSIRDHILRKTEIRYDFISDIAGRNTQMRVGTDQRVLLSLCDATITSAPLRSEAYAARRLNKQLEDQTRKVIRNKDYIEVVVGRKTIVAGNYFKVFKKDFGSYPEYPALFEKSSSRDRGLLRFIFHYLPRDVQNGILSQQKSPWRFNFQSGNRSLNGGE